MTQIPFDGPDSAGPHAPEGPQENVWVAAVRRNPDHARGYAERWRRIEASGQDIYGEARLIDAMAPRGARILDAGCGSGRLGGYLVRVGHSVTGVDLDPHLIEVAREDHPGAHWQVGDLAQLDLRESSHGSSSGERAEHGERALFDLVLCAGNVLTFLSVAERRPALARLAEHLADDGRVVAGFGLGRGYLLADFEADVSASGLALQQRYSSWDLHPVEAGPGFLVAVLTRA